MRKIYIVEEDWFIDGEGDTEMSLFKTRDKATEYYNECVHLEKTEFFTSHYIDENGVLEEGYIIEETPDSFKFYERDYYDTCHSTIRVYEREVR